MNRRRIRHCLAIILAALALADRAAAETSKLGTIHFPNSGREEAQSHFLRGVAALHNFWYEEAAEAFQEGQKADPGFALAYWGEAMTYNHPLWSEQDIAAAREALSRLGSTRQSRLAKAPTARERGYLEAVEILFGEGDKLARDREYSEAMEALTEQYADDREAGCFYALSLLGTVRPGEKGFRRQMKAAAILEEVFRQNPDHPGAAHYLIHSYDDPEHAPLGLPAARRYAEIAPAAHHARHMPSHIFLQLGMWSAVASSNDAAYKASDGWVKRKGLSITKRDYHSLAWLQYGYLQQGRYGKARECLDLIRQVAEETGESRAKSSLASMKARYVIETGHWQKIPVPAEVSTSDRYNSSGDLLLAAGMSAARTGDLASAEEAVARLKALKEKDEAGGRSYQAKSSAIMEKEVAALILIARGRADEALGLMKEATAIEQSMDAPSGPPEPIKPAHELYGEILLQMERPKEAAEQFDKSLLRMPNRAASLLGSARAAFRAGDFKIAHKRYSDLLGIWSQADPELAALEEARAFVARASGS